MDVAEIAAGLQKMSEQLFSEQKRAYAASFSDWPDGYTSCHTHPVVYALWSAACLERPLYIGHTTDPGKRLDVHHKTRGWSHPFTHASFIESERLRDDAYRTLVERFLIYTLEPLDNDRSR